LSSSEFKRTVAVGEPASPRKVTAGRPDPHLTIELRDAAMAEELRRRLRSFDVEAVEADGHWELRIHLRERNPESKVTAALSAIDGWLAVSAVDQLSVRLDGSSYTLHALQPQPPQPDRGSPQPGALQVSGSQTRRS